MKKDSRVAQPNGLSFPLPELLMIQAWAEFHELRLLIELDYAGGNQEYEEILSIYDRGSPFRRCIMWRISEWIVIQQIFSPAAYFPSMTDALDSFGLAHSEEPVTDLQLRPREAAPTRLRAGASPRRPKPARRSTPAIEPPLQDAGLAACVRLGPARP